VLLREVGARRDEERLGPGLGIVLAEGLEHLLRELERRVGVVALELRPRRREQRRRPLGIALSRLAVALDRAVDVAAGGREVALDERELGQIGALAPHVRERALRVLEAALVDRELRVLEPHEQAPRRLR